MTDKMEDKLLRYVDGRLTPAEHAEVDAWLAADPALAQRVRADLADIVALRGATAHVLEEEIPQHLIAAARARPQAKRRFPVAIAASAAMLAIGLGLGFTLAREFAPPPAPAAATNPADTVMADIPPPAVAAHRLYVAEVRHPVEVPASEEEHLVNWLSRRLGTKLIVPRLDTYGFTLVGGRLLPGGSGPAAQFMYETRDGKRLTLYVCSETEARQTSFRFQENNGVSMFYWQEGKFGYALLSETPRDTLLPVAKRVYATLIEDRKD